MTISFLVWGSWINELSLTLTPKKGKRKEKKNPVGDADIWDSKGGKDVEFNVACVKLKEHVRYLHLKYLYIL